MLTIKNIDKLVAKIIPYTNSEWMVDDIWEHGYRYKIAILNKVTNKKVLIQINRERDFNSNFTGMDKYYGIWIENSVSTSFSINALINIDTTLLNIGELINRKIK